MDIEDLEAVCAARVHGNYVDAAAHLMTSPSVISRRVARVEERLGIRIFRRATKTQSLALTEDGCTVMDDLEAVVARYNAVLKVCQIRKEADSQSLRIGYSPFIGNFLLKNLLGQFTVDHPNINIYRHIPMAQNLVEMLFDGSLDAIFTLISDEVPWAQSDFSKLMSQETYAACRWSTAPCSRWACRRTIRWQTAAPFPRSCFLGSITRRFCSRSRGGPSLPSVWPI